MPPDLLFQYFVQFRQRLHKNLVDFIHHGPHPLFGLDERKDLFVLLDLEGQFLGVHELRVGDRLAHHLFLLKTHLQNAEIIEDLAGDVVLQQLVVILRFPESLSPIGWLPHTYLPAS